MEPIRARKTVENMTDAEIEIFLNNGGYEMGKINIDMWYNDKPEQVTGLDIYFNDLGGFYSGNLRIFGKIVGGYYSETVQDIKKAFPHLAKYIENCLN